MPKQFLTVKEVARLLGVTPLTVRNWDARGKLTAHRHPMNNYRLYKTTDIENLLKELEISKVAHKIPSLPPARPELVVRIPHHGELVESVEREPEKPKERKLKIDVL